MNHVSAPNSSPLLPHWPRAATPRRVAILGWARLAHQAAEGSGYNLSASDLATGLALSGHEVFYLASGRRYNLVPWMYVARTERWRGIECFDVVNSPNLSPAAYNFRQQDIEASHPRQCAVILKWLRAIRAEVLHVHSLEGCPLDLIAHVRDAGIPVIVTPHNYWYVCPQVDLMHGETSICMDFEQGRKCEQCLRPKPVAAVKLKRRFGQTLERWVSPLVTGPGRQVVEGLAHRWQILRGKRAAPLPNDLPATPDTGAPLSTNVAVERETTGFDGLIPQATLPGPEDRARRPLARSPIDQNEKFLSATHHLPVLNNGTAHHSDYVRRRSLGVQALNRASRVIPPSDFVRRTMVAMGVEDARTGAVRLGQRHFDQIQRRARQSPFYRSRPWDPASATRPLRFAYFGTMRPSKGIDILAQAIAALPRDIRQRCQFILRIGGWDWPIRKKLIAFPEVSFLGGYDVVHLVAAGGEYDVGILPHVWFENSPLVLLEHLHAGKFVIASRLGGPPEWIIEPSASNASQHADLSYNGLLLPGGDVDALVEAIRRVVVGEVALPSAAEIHAITPNLQTYVGHVCEVAKIYEEAIAEVSPSATSNRS